MSSVLAALIFLSNVARRVAWRAINGYYWIPIQSLNNYWLNNGATGLFSYS